MNDTFNYVAVLVSIVIGLAATHLMTGLSEMIQSENRGKVYWVHTLWIVTLFFQLTLFWWVLYRWRMLTNWTFFFFLWVTFPAVLFYLAASILFPGELEKTGSPDWHDYYYKNRRGFFLVFGVMAPIDIVDSLLKGWQHFLDLGPLYLPFTALWFGGSMLAAITRNERYHAGWALAFPLLMSSWMALALARG